MNLGTDKILFSRAGHVGLVTLNNPEKRNAISFRMWQALQACFEAMAADGGIRVAILRASGGISFGSGADISEFEALRKTAEQAVAYDAQLEASRIAMRGFPKPLIAEVDGYCLAGGLALAMYADMRIVSDKSVFGVPAARMGVAYTLESFRLLNQLVGPSNTADLLMTARRIDAAEALRIGLVNRVTSSADLARETMAVAEAIAGNAPLSVLSAKAIIADLLKDREDRTEGLAQKWRDICHDSADYTEGRKAFLEKRKPVFTGT